MSPIVNTPSGHGSSVKPEAPTPACYCELKFTLDWDFTTSAREPSFCSRSQARRPRNSALSCLPRPLCSVRVSQSSLFLLTLTVFWTILVSLEYPAVRVHLLFSGAEAEVMDLGGSMSQKWKCHSRHILSKMVMLTFIT